MNVYLTEKDIIHSVNLSQSLADENFQVSPNVANTNTSWQIFTEVNIHHRVIYLD